VIGAVCRVVLMGLVSLEAKEVVTPASAHVAIPPPATFQASARALETGVSVPVSLLIRNEGGENDRLLGGETPIAQRLEVRRTLLVDGRLAAAYMPEGIAIPAGATLNLEPGKCHLSLVGLRTPLVQGETFPLTLRFERAGTVTVTARVRRRVDAAGTSPLPEASAGDLTIALVSAPPAPAP
jgi:periplasmic copper chaperone A